MRNPDGPPVIATGEEFPAKEAWEWCFFSEYRTIYLSDVVVHSDITAENMCLAFYAHLRTLSDTDFDLSSCFAWLGTGAFVSRSRVLSTLQDVTTSPATTPSSQLLVKPMKRDELAMLDNAFVTLQNEPPYVIESRLVPMTHSQGKEAFTKGVEGDIMNDLYIVSGEIFQNGLQSNVDQNALF